MTEMMIPFPKTNPFWIHEVNHGEWREYEGAITMYEVVDQVMIVRLVVKRFESYIDVMIQTGGVRKSIFGKVQLNLNEALKLVEKGRRQDDGKRGATC